MNIGEEFSAEVTDLSFKGLGVIKHGDGRVFFCAGVWPGDHGLFQVTKLKKRYGFLDLIQLSKPSTHRASSPCKKHGFNENSCGGCGWMHVSIDAQLEAKQTHVEKLALQVDSTTKVHPIKSSPNALGYRSRASFKSDGRALGFFAYGTKKIVDIENCPVLTPNMQKKLSEIRALLPNKGWGTRAKIKDMHINEESLIDSDSNFAHNFFSQTNVDQNDFMKNWVSNKIKDQINNGSILELFCGSGNFTEVLATHLFSVDAYDSSQHCIDTLNKKKFSRIKGHCIDLYDRESLATLSQANHKTLLLDPPRAGYVHFADLLAQNPEIKDVLYVSCNPDSFFRDIYPSIGSGWRLKEIQPVDQFPHTPHIELLSHLEKR